jgi:hypothetical protein
MADVSKMFMGGIILIVLGVLSFIIVYTMLPSQLSAQADLLCSTTSGVTLSASQKNLVNNFSNLGVVVMLLVPILLVLGGVVTIVYTAFKGKGG